ncbi:hypothetical protein EAF04_006771 [Stromatinia cepivora]|nr:hypothetical protein EAF04_006771 [Stromatinia cepivora]
MLIRCQSSSYVGIEISRQLQTYLSEASHNACNATSIDDVLLGNPKFLDCLDTAWKHLPEKSRTKILNRFSNQPQRVHTHRMWNKKTISKEPIKINKDVKAILPLWRSQPSAFLDQLSVDPLGSPRLPSQLYLNLHRLQQTRSIESVRWRFLLVAFYELREDVNKTYFHSKNYVRSEVQDEFISIICQSDMIKDTYENIKKNYVAWAKGGERYHVLIEELGGRGTLLLLPDDTQPHIWEHEMPKSGDDHNKMIQSLKSRGICEEANETKAHEAADRIWKYYRELMNNWIESRTNQSIISRSLSNTNQNIPAIDAGPVTSKRNPNSTYTLLNTDYIAGLTQDQQLPSVRNPSIQIPSGARLTSYEQDSQAVSTAGEYDKFGSNRKGKKRSRVTGRSERPA